MRINTKGVAQSKKLADSQKSVPNFGFVVFEDEKAATECLSHKPINLPNGHRLNVETKKKNVSRFPFIRPDFWFWGLKSDQNWVRVGQEESKFRGYTYANVSHIFGLSTINSTNIFLPSGTLLESGNVRIPIETEGNDNIIVSRIDNFELTNIIGSGSFGNVYKCKNKILNYEYLNQK